MSLGDPETETVSTPATASPGRPYQGGLFAPHGGNTDTDWVRIPMNPGEQYQIIVVSDPKVKTSITNAYGPQGDAINGFEPVSSPEPKPLFSTDPNTGEQVLSGYQHGGEGTYGSWLETIIDAPSAGNHFIAFTGEPASYRQGPQLGIDGMPAPGATASIVEWDFHGTEYTVHVWSSGQAHQHETPGTDTSTQDAFTPTQLNPQGDDTTGHINQAGDTDWFSTWMKRGTEYAIILDAKSTDASIAGVLELPWPSIDLPGHHTSVARENTGVSNCSIHIYRARRDGAHFIAVTGQTTGEYALSAIEISQQRNFRYPEERDRGSCAGAGYLQPHQWIVGTTPGTDDSDTHFVRLQAGIAYEIQVLYSNDNPNRQSNLIHPDGTTEAGTGPNTLDHFRRAWNITPAQTAHYAIRHSIVGTSYNDYLISVIPDGTPDLPRVDLWPQSPFQINEGDVLNYEAEVDAALGHDLQVWFDLTATEDYPKFQGGPRHSVTIPAGQTTQRTTVTTLNDDVHAGTADNAYYTIVTATLSASDQYRQGYESNPQHHVTGGSYVPELDENDMETGQMVFDNRADSIYHGFHGCTSPQDTQIIHLTVAEAAGTVPITVDVPQWLRHFRVPPRIDQPGRPTSRHRQRQHNRHSLRLQIQRLSAPGQYNLPALGQVHHLQRPDN